MGKVKVRIPSETALPANVRHTGLVNEAVPEVIDTDRAWRVFAKTENFMAFALVFVP